MTGWLAVAGVAVLIVTGAYCVVALDKWDSRREWERREAKRNRWRAGAVWGDTGKRSVTPMPDRPSRL